MKCQQLQMKLLNSENSNKNSLLFTKRTCFCSSKRLLILRVIYVKDKREACFRPFGNLDMGISASVSTLRTFCFCLIKIYFKKLSIYVQ